MQGFLLSGLDFNSKTIGKNMKKILSRTTITVMSAVAALMTCATYLPAAEGDNATDNHAAQRGQFVRKDYKFARDAYNANLLEVRLGELAKQKGSIEAAKQFADQMVKDHTKANDELKQIIEKKGAVLPGQLSHRQESEYTRLQKLTGKDFDKSYADHMVKEHKKDIKE